jgi:DNA-binding MarR family transcriptional regulator
MLGGLSIGPAGVSLGARLDQCEAAKTPPHEYSLQHESFDVKLTDLPSSLEWNRMLPTPMTANRSEKSQVRTVMAAVRRIMHAADLRSRRLSRETGLTAPQLAILQAIADLGEVTTGRISADVSLSQATVTVILDRLVERALVERYRSPDDRRIVHSRLTEAGQRALAAAEPAVSARLVREFERMPADKQAELVAALEWMVGALGVGDEEWPTAV